MTPDFSRASPVRGLAILPKWMPLYSSLIEHPVNRARTSPNRQSGGRTGDVRRPSGLDSAQGTYPAGIRPTKQNRNRPAGRASSIQPSGAFAYNRANAATSAPSARSTPANKYAALPSARNASAVGLVQTFKHACARTSKSPSGANRAATSSTNAAPFGSPPIPAHVEHINKLWVITPT